MATAQLPTRCPDCRKRYPDVKKAWCKKCDFPKVFGQWTSGDSVIDEFIKMTQNQQRNYEDNFLEWIPFDRFRDKQMVGQGGYGTVYSAEWIDGRRYWDQSTRARQPCKVALKNLNSGMESHQIFIEEVRSHYEVHNTSFMSNSFPMYGLSQDPVTKEYLIVMPFVENGSLRTFFNKNFHTTDWEFKLQLLYSIAFRLSHIHSRKMVHRDLHGGNILVMIDQKGHGKGEISDFGLCRSTVNDIKEGDVFGVLPYVAPEVLLKGEAHTPAADIYAFGVIMCEMTTGQPAFCDRAHDVSLFIDILNGTRPTIHDGTPEEYVLLAKRCLEADPEKRPGAWELRNFFSNRNSSKSVPPEYRKADEHKKYSPLPRTSPHNGAVYTSRSLNFSKSLNLLGYRNANSSQLDSRQIDLELPEGFDG